jgi:predicted ArsR family transcriptional regulator
MSCYNVKKINEEVVTEIFDKLKGNPVGFGIIISLRLYGAMNLKALSNILQVGETTILHQIKNLIKEELLVLDASATVKQRGKFYTLSEISISLLNYIEKQESDEFKEKSLKLNSNTSEKDILKHTVNKFTGSDLESKLSIARMLITMSHQIQNLSINKLKDTIEEINQLNSDEDKIELIRDNGFLALFAISNTKIEIHTVEQLVKIRSLFDNIFEDLISLKQEIEKDQIPTNHTPLKKPLSQFWYQFLTPLDPNSITIE